VVLTLGAGAIDAISFLRLGGVFSSVITGNLVLLGLAAGRANGGLAAHVAVAGMAFVGGILFGARLAGPVAPGHPVWPTRVNVALASELAALAVFVGWWAATGGRPSGADQFGLLALAALAMGIQSAAVRAIGIAGLSTTYMTGTLTTALANVVTAGKLQWYSLVLILSVVVGAAMSGLLLAMAPAAAPALPVGLVAIVLGTAALAVPRLPAEKS
jgi:uncharacterized membrane protein YoaK (UPF0700 family)